MATETITTEDEILAKPRPWKMNWECALNKSKLPTPNIDWVITIKTEKDYTWILEQNCLTVPYTEPFRQLARLPEQCPAVVFYWRLVFVNVSRLSGCWNRKWRTESPLCQTLARLHGTLPAKWPYEHIFSKSLVNLGPLWVVNSYRSSLHTGHFSLTPIKHLFQGQPSSSSFQRFWMAA